MNLLFSWLERWRSSVSLTLFALVITGVAGVFFWFFQDQIYSRNMQEIMHAHLLLELQEKAQEDWKRMDEQFRSQDRAVQLLVDREAFVRYIEKRELAQWSEDEEVGVVHHQDQPSWLPDLSIMQGLVHAVHVVLADANGRVRETYGVDGKLIPDSLLDGLVKTCATRESLSSIQSWQGVPYFLTRVALRDSKQRLRAILVFGTPMDDDFLLAFQFAHQFQGIQLFLDDEGLRVMASSRPDLVADGTLVADLDRDYLQFGKSFLDYGFSSDVLMRFVTLIPKAQLADLSQSIVSEGRMQRAAGHFMMIIVFIMIIYWVGVRIRGLTRQMVTFAQERLGLELAAARSGNPLQQVMEQFDIFSNEIEQARQREAQALARLTKTNHALESSLTLLKRTHVQLLATEKMASLGGLVAGVAHEINTPVGIGVTAASFLESKTKECRDRFVGGTLSKVELEGYLSDAAESAGMILSNLLRAADLVRSFKQVAVDTSSEACRLFDFSTVIHHILLSLHPSLKKTRHKVTVQCPVGLVYFGRPDVFSQIISNFVLNSLQHGFVDGQVGEIIIEVAQQENEILLRYADNGLGMADGDRQQIFEPFFTTARNRGGSGLGMHIVFNLVTTTLGGQIVCTSTLGEGIVFAITFPARNEAEQDQQPLGGTDGRE